MENATTVIFPVGNVTAAVARKVADSLDDATAQGRTGIISLQLTARWTWGALCELAESLRRRHGKTRVSFTHVPPTGRALLDEVGLGGEWIVEDAPPAAAQRVLISA